MYLVKSVVSLHLVEILEYGICKSIPAYPRAAVVVHVLVDIPIGEHFNPGRRAELLYEPSAVLLGTAYVGRFPFHYVIDFVFRGRVHGAILALETGPV